MFSYCFIVWEQGKRKNMSEATSHIKCASCGHNLPEGAAYCPTCGTITPYNSASSHINTYISPSNAVTHISPGSPQRHPHRQVTMGLTQLVLLLIISSAISSLTIGIIVIKTYPNPRL